MRARAGYANAIRPHDTRISETLVFPAPAVASAGRDVVVTRDRADRPVHAQTFSGAPLKGFRAGNACICAGDVNVGSILRRKLARDRVLSITTMCAEDGTFSARVERDYVFNPVEHVITQSRDQRPRSLSSTQPR
jgi:hypothetical protein